MSDKKSQRPKTVKEACLQKGCRDCEDEMEDPVTFEEFTLDEMIDAILLEPTKHCFKRSTILELFKSDNKSFAKNPMTNQLLELKKLDFLKEHNFSKDEIDRIKNVITLEQRQRDFLDGGLRRSRAEARAEAQLSGRPEGGNTRRRLLFS